MAPPSTIGPYAVERELGRGGVGAVFLARDPRDGARVVVKTLQWAGDVNALERFQREAAIGVALRHEGIVKTLDSGRDANGPYLVMEYVEGETLAAIVERGPLDAARARAIVRDVALAVAHAHDQGVLHRDLKPANVLIDARGRPLVADFGMSRASGHGSLSASGELVGTATYLPPEQVAGDSKAHGVAGDVWALGAILHEALAGRPPFRAGSIVALFHKIANDPPDPLPAGTPRDLATIVHRCLAKDPAARYPSARALAGALDGAPPSAEPSHRPRRSAWLVAAALGGGGLLLAGAIGLPWLWRSKRPSPPPPPAAPPAPPPVSSAAERARALEQLLVEADAAHHRNRLAQAIGLYGRAIALDPRSVAAREGRALILVEGNNIPAAIVDLRALDGLVTTGCGQALFALVAGDEQRLGVLIAEAPSPWIPLFARGLVRVAGERRSLEALDDFVKAESLAPWCAAIRFRIGTALSKSGDFAGALAFYDTVERDCPDVGADFFYARGFARAPVGLHAEAVQDHTRAIALQPDLAMAHFARALELVLIEEPARAIEDFEAVVRLLPPEHDYHVASLWHASDTALALGRKEQALDYALKGLRIAPWDGFLHRSGAAAFRARSTLEQDATDVRAAAGDHPGDPLRWAVVVCVEEARGDIERTVAALERLRACLERDGRQRAVQDVVGRIGQIRATGSLGH